MTDLDQGNDENDQLDCVAKGDVHQSAHSIAEPLCNTLGSVSKKACQGHDGDGVHGKDDAIRKAGKMDGNADGDKDEEDIDPAGGQDVPDDIEETDHNRPLLWLWLFLLPTSRGRIAPVCGGIMIALALGWSWCSG